MARHWGAGGSINATQARKVTQDDFGQHQDRDRARQAAEASGRHRAVAGAQIEAKEAQMNRDMILKVVIAAVAIVVLLGVALWTLMALQ